MKFLQPKEGTTPLTAAHEFLEEFNPFGQPDMTEKLNGHYRGHLTVVLKGETVDPNSERDSESPTEEERQDSTYYGDRTVCTSPC